MGPEDCRKRWPDKVYNQLSNIFKLNDTPTIACVAKRIAFERHEVLKLIGEQLTRLVSEEQPHAEALCWLEQYGPACLLCESRSVVMSWCKAVLESLASKKEKTWTQRWFQFASRMIQAKEFDHSREAGIVLWATAFKV